MKPIFFLDTKVNKDITRKKKKDGPMSFFFFFNWSIVALGLPRWPSGKKPAGRRLNAGDVRRGFDPWVGKIPWSRKWHPTLVFLPDTFHGQRSLASYSPWGHKVRQD